MAVSPYVSRAELWLANSSFRPTFHLPNDFHPSVFLKWFPGHMAKGLLLSAVEIIFDNTEETISKWQLIHCWCICYSFTYDATPITKMRLCNRSSWCENILYSAKICMIKVMHLSMLSPRVGGAGRPRGIWHFNVSQRQIPHPQAPTKCQFPASGVTFSNRVRT